jgi:hypothetical protein
MRSAGLVPIIALAFGFTPVVAQVLAAQERPRPVIDFSGGWAGFPDDGSTINHRMVGVSARFYFTPRLSVGPEVVYMVGPGTDRDLFVTGNVTYEWPLLVSGRVPRVMPFVVASGGYMRHTPRFGTSISHTGTVVGGGGVRVRITDRVSAGPDLRLGLELHLRVAGTVTIGLGP